MINQEHTPLMQQYHEIKAAYPDVLLLFQVGEFFELFFEDAKIAATHLGIALTARGKNKGEPIPLCGVPMHALDYYLVKLVKAGFKVGICEQLEPPKPGTVVKRGITQVLTPGTLTDAKLLDAKSASYLFSFFPMQESWGLVFAELLTAQLFATVIPVSSERVLESELVRFFPDEVVVPNNKEGKKLQAYLRQLGYFTTMVEEHPAESALYTDAQVWMQQQFKTAQYQQVYNQESLRLAMTYFYAYVKRTNQDALSQFAHIQLYKPEDFLFLDGATQRNLELVKNNRDGSVKHTLFSVMDHASTPMGSRMVKKWVMRPLIKEEAINQRFDVVEFFSKKIQLLHQAQSYLSQIGDLERIVGRIGVQRAQVHDYIALSRALQVLPDLQLLVSHQHSLVLLDIIKSHMSDFSLLSKFLEAALNDDSLRSWIIKKGFHEELDRIRDLAEHGNQKILEMEREQQEATGISSLKIRYNQVHGYSIEITKTHFDAVPSHYIRQQTLVGRERFVTPELQKLQAEILSAQSESEALEKRIFENVKMEVFTHISALRKLTHALAHLDALCSFSALAYNYNYVRPVFNASRDINIIAGRHPVIEQTLSTSFIPNDTSLVDAESLWIITGPNMGGKSTYLRQVALISIMAQCGSFIPAKQASLALLDRIFTRIGAGDNLADGKSTFLVEMEETAIICTQATKNSLVILDEVGRGTSTFDGLAIAQAVVEYLYTQVNARCLFATHYHELTHLQERYSGIANYYAACRKNNAGIVFLYTMMRGVADGSFGIEVARLAQLPASIVDRAQDVLTTLSVPNHNAVALSDSDQLTEAYQQLFKQHENLKKIVSELQAKDAEMEIVKEQLATIDFNELSPKAAFDFLWKLKENTP